MHVDNNIISAWNTSTGIILLIFMSDVLLLLSTILYELNTSKFIERMSKRLSYYEYKNLIFNL